jgi:hypothetical protein
LVLFVFRSGQVLPTTAFVGAGKFRNGIVPERDTVTEKGLLKILWGLGGGEFYIGNCWIVTGMGYGGVFVDEAILSEGVPVWHLK